VLRWFSSGQTVQAAGRRGPGGRALGVVLRKRGKQLALELRRRLGSEDLGGAQAAELGGDAHAAEIFVSASEQEP
jgi:hypothetical protein